MSIPKDPQQPDAISYAPSALAIVPRFTREAYEAQFGPAPAPVPTLPYKDWFDSSPATMGDGAILYCSGYAADGTPLMMRLPKTQACRVNYPAPKSYPTYLPAPTNAVYSFRDGETTTPLDPADLATKADADAIAKELGGSVVDFTVNSGMRRFQPNGDARREYAVMWPDGAWELVGNLLVKKYRFGVGAPVAPSGRNWVLLAQNTDVAPGDPVPVPLRHLLPNESVVPSLMGEIQIVRTDKQPLPSPAASSGLTAEEHRMLSEIHAVVVK